MPNAQVSKSLITNYVMLCFANAVDKINGKKYQYSFLKPTKIDF